jgi:hypothetical protein
MNRKNIVERKSEKLSQLKKLKEEIAKLESQAVDQIGRIAIKAGLTELAIDDDLLLKEFQAIAAKFREQSKEPTGQEALSPSPS